MGGFSLGSLGVIVGSVLTLVGFGAYFFSDNATLNLAGFFYGIPLLLGGLALKSAELKPVPLSPVSDSTIVSLRSQQATKTQKEILNDVTRYRYGEEAHLQLALERLGLSPSDNDRPLLQSIREESRDGAYCLVLSFESPHVDLATWQGKQDKMTRFFGPDIRIEVSPATEVTPSSSLIQVALIRVPGSSDPSPSSPGNS